MNKIAVTIPDATALSGIGRSSLYKLFNQGKLTPRKSGKRTLILVAELEDYVKNLPAGGPTIVQAIGEAGDVNHRTSTSDTGQ